MEKKTRNQHLEVSKKWKSHDVSAGFLCAANEEVKMGNRKIAFKR